MKPWGRVKHLLSEPTYRTRLAFFMLLGGVLILLAIVIKHPFWSDILLEFAVVFVAVASIQFLWDFLGGDPMELQLKAVQNEIMRVGQSVSLLSDLIDGNIGIERIWPDRQAWQLDSKDGLTVWQTRVYQANRVDIMSISLWNNWMHQRRFRRSLFANIARGASVRILLCDPESDVLRLRARDEEDPRGQVQMEIKSTLLGLAQGWDNLEDAFKKNLQVRLTTSSLHLVQLIRADELMIVAFYLSGMSGGPSPTMQLRGLQSIYFVKYEEQFEIMWERGTPLGDDDFRRILEEFKGLPPAPVEA